MLSAYYQVCCAVLLAVFCHAQALAPSHHNNNLTSRVFGSKTRCSWNCTAIESDLTEEMKIAIASKETLIQLVVKYEKKVDDNCVNQTSRNSSRNATENLQIWLGNKQRSTFAKLMESLKNLMFTNSNEERKDIRVLCTLRPSELTTDATLEYNKEIQFALFSRGHLAALEVDLNTTDFNTTNKGSLEPCKNISNSTDNNCTNSKSPFERGGWPMAVFFGFSAVFLAVFVHYSLAFLCLFSPTEVTEEGICQILLEGASPVSFRSLIGNYFFSEDDRTIWHKARTFIFRVVIMPLPFLVLINSTDLNIFSFLKQKLFGVFIIIMVCCVCYLIQAFCISFFPMRFVQAKPCSVCKCVKPKIFSCHDELPQKIMSHLRLQPLIIVKCWRLFIQYMLRYLKISLIFFPSSNLSIVYFLRLFTLIVFLSTVPPATVILSILVLLLAAIGILLSSPIYILCRVCYSAISVPFYIVFVILRNLAVIGVFAVIGFAGVGALKILLLVIALLFHEESLPYLACIVLICYYVWSSYNSFTNSYQDFALALFKHCKKLLNDLDASTDQMQKNIAAEYEDDEIKIAKRLFQMACEELMPIREGICKMILKITTIASFVVLVSSIAILQSEGANPFMKALLTFFTGSFPKIAIIYIDGDRQKKIKCMVTDQKIPKIVQEYMEKRAVTIRSNHVQDNCDADGNAEVMSLNDNEENNPLINI